MATSNSNSDLDVSLNSAMGSVFEINSGSAEEEKTPVHADNIVKTEDSPKYLNCQPFEEYIMAGQYSTKLVTVFYRENI